MRGLFALFFFFSALTHGELLNPSESTHRSISIPFAVRTSEGTVQQIPFHYSYRLPKTIEDAQKETNSTLTQLFIDQVRFEAEIEFYRTQFLKAKLHNKPPYALFKKEFIGNNFIKFLNTSRDFSVVRKAELFAFFSFNLVSYVHYRQLKNQSSSPEIFINADKKATEATALLTNNSLSKFSFFLNRQYFMKNYHEKIEVDPQKMLDIDFLMKQRYRGNYLSFMQVFKPLVESLSAQIVKEDALEVSDDEILKRAYTQIRKTKIKLEEDFKRRAPELKPALESLSFIEKMEPLAATFLKARFQITPDEAKKLSQLPAASRAEAVLAFQRINSFLKEQKVFEEKIYEIREDFLSLKNPILRELVFEEAYQVALNKFNSLKEKNDQEYALQYKEEPKTEALSFALSTAKSESLNNEQELMLGEKSWAYFLRDLNANEKLESYFNGTSKEFTFDFQPPKESEELQTVEQNKPQSVDEVVENHLDPNRMIAVGVGGLIVGSVAWKAFVSKKTRMNSGRKKLAPPSSDNSGGSDPSPPPKPNSPEVCAPALSEGFLNEMGTLIQDSRLPTSP